MKTKLTLVLGLLATTLCPPAFAQDTAFTYQGRFNTNNAPYTGSVEFQFTLWDAASGGNAVATSNPANVIASVAAGLFTATLDFGSNPFNGQPRFLQIEARTIPGPFTTLSPRQPLTPAPYAIYSANAAAAATVSGSVPAGLITGTLPLAQLPAAVVTNGASGVNFSGNFTGTGAGLTDLNLTLNSGGAITWPGRFELSSSLDAVAEPNSVTAADVNGDGKPDLIIAHSPAATRSEC